MSVRDYYTEISNGQVQINGDDESVIEWTPANQKYSYYVDVNIINLYNLTPLFKVYTNYN